VEIFARYRVLRHRFNVGAGGRTGIAQKWHRLPSGSLHDAAKVAVAGVPTVLMFVQSLHGISHNKIEDTKEEHLELCVTAFDKLAEKAMKWIQQSPSQI
jgi:hypothetical protein